MKVNKKVRTMIDEVASGEKSPAKAVGEILRMSESLGTGVLIDAVKAQIAAKQIKATAADVEKYIRDNYIYADDLRVDLAVKTLIKIGIVSEAVEVDFSYILLQDVGAIPAGTRVRILTADRLTDEGLLQLQVQPVEDIPDTEQAPDEEDEDEAEKESPKESRRGRGRRVREEDEDEMDFVFDDPDAAPEEDEGSDARPVEELSLNDDEIDLYFDPETEEEPEDDEEEEDFEFPEGDEEEDDEEK